MNETDQQQLGSPDIKRRPSAIHPTEDELDSRAVTMQDSGSSP